VSLQVTWITNKEDDNDQLVGRTFEKCRHGKAAAAKWADSSQLMKSSLHVAGRKCMHPSSRLTQWMCRQPQTQVCTVLLLQKEAERLTEQEPTSPSWSFP
jgi:hypothetical protein